MDKYQTMTVDGGRGSDVMASNDDEAIAKATAMGYKVLDVTDSMDGSLILVIAD